MYEIVFIHWQLAKLQDKLRKLQADVESTKEKYEAALNDLNSYNAKYIEDMTEVNQQINIDM